MASIGSPPAWQYSPALQGYYYIDDRSGRPKTLVTADGRQYPVNGSILRTKEEASSSSSAAGSHAGASRLDAARGYYVAQGPALTQSFQSGAIVRQDAPATNFASKMQPVAPGTPRSTPADRVPPRNLGCTPSSSQVKSIFQIAPPQVSARSRPRNRTDTLLDKDFKVRQEPQEYFVPGKVFMVLWAEPARANSKKSDSGESADSVILEGRNLAQTRAHGIVYTGEQRHEASSVTHDLLPQAVRVFPDVPNDALHPASRINYENVYTVEHNLKVKSFGQADVASTAILLRHFHEVFTAKLGPGKYAKAKTARWSGQRAKLTTLDYVLPPATELRAKPRTIWVRLQTL
nr:hypothetical protein B0A51_03183 [Rachicladosporium sp. CCFEE 5018]